MSHVRQQIREKIVELLNEAEIPGVASDVRKSIFFSLAPFELPVVAVYYDPEAEAVERLSLGGMGSQVNRRETHILIEAFLTAVVDVEDVLDAIAVTIERKLAENPKLGGLVMNSQLSGTEFDRSGEGDEETCSLRLSYAFEYAARADQPEQTAH